MFTDLHDVVPLFSPRKTDSFLPVLNLNIGRITAGSLDISRTSTVNASLNNALLNHAHVYIAIQHRIHNQLH